MADVQDDIKKKLALDHAQEKIDDVITQFLDGRAGGQTDEDLAKQLGLTLVKFDAVDNKGNNVDGTAPTTPIPEQQQLLGAAFAADQGADGDPAFLKDGGSFVVRVDQIDPPAIKDFAKIADQARKDYVAEEQKQRLTAKANDLVAKYKAAGLGAAATEIGATPVALPMPLRRDDASEVLSAELVKSLFRSKRDEPVAGSVAKGDGIVIASATAIATPNAQELAQGTTALSARLDQGLAADIMEQFTADARETLGVRVDRATLDAAATGQ
jgi:peptidyl-prolyl cis-trans isomerase D